MSGSSFGTEFKVSTFGESHGPGIGVVIDGVTPNVPLAVEDIQKELDRRRPGQSAWTTQRQELDQVEVLSGVFQGKTTGTPLAMLIRNGDFRSRDYGNLAELCRPGHADYTYNAKYDIRDYRGGGRSSGRETAARVAAGAVAKILLKTYGVQIRAFTGQIGNVVGEVVDFDFIEQNPLRAADPGKLSDMIQEIDDARRTLDSVGGVVECRVSGVPAGWGEPVFDRLDALLAYGALSIGGVKGIEFGSGFAAGSMRGSEHNDQWENGEYRTNCAGGILGGISSGQELIFRVAVKPTPSIARPQKARNQNDEDTVCEISGRHDPCLCPRLTVVLEAMTALVLIDLAKRQAALRA